MANFQDIAQQFVDFYYKTFDGDRTQLVALYVRRERLLGEKRQLTGVQRPNSMLTFEKEPFQGAQPIVEKLTVSGVQR